ncbi:hypothetical protein DH2020_022341 [Rehmannia glutinosa]|uniref:Endoglucanase n=1 Tax=Rehmannia glutinosa TaxID=99300 RepID=A0ABR0WD28_REHGL
MRRQCCWIPRFDQFCQISVNNVVSIDYGAALTKSLLFYEAQRSGKLPSNQRIQWRGDSALSDGQSDGGLSELAQHSELVRKLEMLKDPHKMLNIWTFAIALSLPWLFEFARKHSGQYQNSISVAGQFYSSSGYEDELLWAVAWLERATNDNTYLEFITQSWNNGGIRRMFSWDDKFVGAQVLVAKGVLEGKFSGNGNLDQLKNNAEQYICNCIQKGYSNVQKTNGGLLWFLEWANLQYVTSASFIITAYADFLANTNTTIQCANGAVGPQDLIDFAKSQVDYILGSNPNQMSYMVGFGLNYPKQVHHRGASIVSIKKDSRPVSCQDGFNEWFHKNAENPNVLIGAIVGGPDLGDQYRDSRDNYQQAEPATANNAPLVGVLAKLAAAYAE